MLETWMSFAFVLIPLMYSPGPTNILVASMGATVGLFNSLAFIVGINLGLILQLIIIALGISSFLVKHQLIFTLLNYLGIIYLFYLSYQFIKAAHCVSEPVQEKKLKSTKAILEGVLIEVLNSKVWLSLILLFSLFTKKLVYLDLHAAHLIIFAVLLNIINNVLWATAGAYLVRLINTGSTLKLHNYVFSVMLIVVAIWMFLSFGDYKL